MWVARPPAGGDGHWQVAVAVVTRKGIGFAQSVTSARFAMIR